MDLPIMILPARKAAKELSADAMFRQIRQGFDHIPDVRADTASISLGDALMSAFAMFSLKGP